MRTLFGTILLTSTALLGLGAIVYLIMHFATGQVGLPTAYWLVPVFGAGGGVVGGILKNDNALILPRVELPNKILLGVIGDISVGMGGACVIVFVFGNTLRINQTDALSNALLISMSFIAGVVGKQLVELAGKKFIHEAAKAGKVAGEKAAEEAVKKDLTPVAVVAYEETATRLNNEGKFRRALEIVERLLEYDPKNIYAYVEKARALKRSGDVQKALETVEQALRIQPEDLRLLYNRACYMAILGMDEEKILADLKMACEKVPQYCELARTDADLQKINQSQQFQHLMLRILDEALRTRSENAPEVPRLRYSRAGYRARLRMDKGEILQDLKMAITAKPELKAGIHKDVDLAAVLSPEEIKSLITEA